MPTEYPILRQRYNLKMSKVQHFPRWQQRGHKRPPFVFLRCLNLECYGAAARFQSWPTCKLLQKVLFCKDVRNLNATQHVKPHTLYLLLFCLIPTVLISLWHKRANSRNVKFQNYNFKLYEFFDFGYIQFQLKIYTMTLVISI